MLEVCILSYFPTLESLNDPITIEKTLSNLPLYVRNHELAHCLVMYSITLDLGIFQLLLILKHLISPELKSLYAKFFPIINISQSSSTVISSSPKLSMISSPLFILALLRC